MGSRPEPRWARRVTKPDHYVALWHVVPRLFPPQGDSAACAWRADVPPWEPGAALEWCEGYPVGRRFVCDYCTGYDAGWVHGTEFGDAAAPEEADVERLTRALLGSDEEGP